MVHIAVLLIYNNQQTGENISRDASLGSMSMLSLHISTILIDTCGSPGHQHRNIASIKLAQYEHGKKINVVREYPSHGSPSHFSSSPGDQIQLTPLPTLQRNEAQDPEHSTNLLRFPSSVLERMPRTPNT